MFQEIFVGYDQTIAYRVGVGLTSDNSHDQFNYTDVKKRIIFQLFVLVIDIFKDIDMTNGRVIPPKCPYHEKTFNSREDFSAYLTASYLFLNTPNSKKNSF
jgi:hypothetical protein